MTPIERDYLDVMRNKVKSLEEKLGIATEALEHIREYWNHAPESSVDAAEEARQSSAEALEKMGVE